MKPANRSILSFLSEETQKALFASGEKKDLPKGGNIFSETEETDEIFLLLEGFVSLYRDSYKGETRVIFICAEGELLNEIALSFGKNAVSAVALTPCRVLCMKRGAFEALLASHGDLRAALFQSLARKTARLYHKVGNDNGTYALINRMAATLWKLTRDYGHEIPAGRHLGFDLSVNFLATYMGAKRESVSRALSTMKKQGLILHEDGKLTVPDMDALKRAISQ